MTRVYGYVGGVAFATAGAWLTRESGGLPFWLFAIGAGGFLFAAISQFFGTQQSR